ncbi:MAG: fibronectin type III domain-containing protein [Pseudomonadota bacterium]
MLFPHACFAAPGVPSGLATTPSETAIKVSWTANTDTALGYYLYWGVKDSLDVRQAIGDAHTSSFNIDKLQSNTTYYFAISAYDTSGESPISAIVQGKTSKDTAVPAKPTGLNIKSYTEVTDSSVGLMWNQNKEADLSGYKILCGTVPGNVDLSLLVTYNKDVNTCVLPGLVNATRYYVSMVALDISGNESAKSEDIIVDILPDSRAPNVPQNIKVGITGSGEVSVSFNGNNAGMADLKGYCVYYGESSGLYDTSIPIGMYTSCDVSDLKEGAVYYFAVSALDMKNNESQKSESTAIEIEKLEGLLNDDVLCEGGCFIDTAGQAVF